MTERRRFSVRGIVQGVGFRPFVYRLAQLYRLSGYVLNDSLGVTIEAEGDPGDLDAFAGRLTADAPPMAVVTSVEAQRLELLREAGFDIRDSRKGARTSTLISPDIGVCGECLAEMTDPKDRRHRYPFINCTNCGPRYTIIEDIPYDRPKTSMKHFTMCPDCAAEYEDPASRRFHAQPNACSRCGPRLILLEGDGARADARLDPLAETVRRLQSGEIAAVKGLGGFHLAADAVNQEAVLRLRRRKNREEKPFAVMVPDLAAARRLAVLSEREAAEMASPRRPIVLAAKRQGHPLAEAVAPASGDFGIMLPYTPLHHLLFADGKFTALVMTSANLSEEPLCIDNDEAVRRLAGIADFYLSHDRIIYLRTDDSVIRVFRDGPYPVRRSRGYAPAPVSLSRTRAPVMGLGAELKNTVCLIKGDHAFLSQHIGDLSNQEAFAFFSKTVEHLERILECRAELLAYDLHPDYLASRYALEQGERPAVGVQHHHAHAVSCMAEHGLEGPVLAVAFDGTGYGDDGHIWGGEFLVADAGGYRRAAHLLEVPMPGGDMAIREPFRMALAYLHKLYGRECAGRAAQFMERHPPKTVEVLTAMLDRGIHLVPTSSAGRLFDAVSSLLGVRDRITFEGQAAMDLEAAARGVKGERGYQFDMDTSGKAVIIDTLPIIAGLLGDLRRETQVPLLAARFHESLAALIAGVSLEVGGREGLDRVVLSGGVFQNMTLLGRTVELLKEAGLSVYWHVKVPANDGGLSLGQAVIAREVCSGGRS